MKLKSTKPKYYPNVNGVKTLIKFHSLKFTYILDNVYALGYFAIKSLYGYAKPVFMHYRYMRRKNAISV